MKLVVQLVISFILMIPVKAQRIIDSSICKEFTLSINCNNSEIDSIRIIFWSCSKREDIYCKLVNGKATVKGFAAMATEGIIFTNISSKDMDSPGVIRFIIEQTKMFIDFDVQNNYVKNVRIKGSKSQTEKLRWEQAQSASFLLEKMYEDSLKLPHISKEKRKTLLVSSDSVRRIIVTKAIDYIGQNKDSYFSGYLLNRYLRRISLDSAKRYYNAFDTHVKKSNLGQLILADIFALTTDESFLEQNSTPEFFKKLKAMQNFHDIVLPDISGNKVELSVFKGKWILVDFWGSWCIPCIRNVPYLKELMNKMADDSVAFISISLDKNVEVWRKAIAKHNYPGLNLIDSAHLVSTFYHVPWVPVYMLIDPEGKISKFDLPQPITGDLSPVLNSLIGKLDD